MGCLCTSTEIDSGPFRGLPVDRGWALLTYTVLQHISSHFLTSTFKSVF